MNEHPAKGCTPKQKETFERIAIGMPPNATFKTLGALEKKGLIVRGADKVLG